ncbi:uncharacterized protein LOC128673301 [Plodia interpunctella]|uniref:uncharacterized protein LOC128673301 n=1 Tax=Plodia interpunctella TaxID=58824 RepID=UPI002367C6EA|nr:uncharacterized protein LOC128673301 [Plodia interpunctella]
MAYNTVLIILFYFFQITVKGVYTLPPDRCFMNFRWDDCGQPATAVIYYYKPGSRCEVGMWRGCLPNHNMFANEYECVSTCIFTMRAMPQDYHNLVDQYPDEEFMAELDHLDTTTGKSGNDTVLGEEERGNGTGGTDQTGGITGTGTEATATGDDSPSSTDSAANDTVVGTDGTDTPAPIAGDATGNPDENKVEGGEEGDENKEGEENPDGDKPADEENPAEEDKPPERKK